MANQPDASGISTTSCSNAARSVLLGISLLAFAGSSFAQQATLLKRPPESDIRAKSQLNLARAYLGTSIREVGADQVDALNPGILSNDPNDSPAALISSDETIGCPVRNQRMRVIVTLPRPELLSSLEFASYQASGTVNAWVSSIGLPADDKRWRHVVKGKSFARDQVFKTKFGSVDASYVMIEILPNEPGRICALGLFGETKIEDVTVRTKEHPSDFSPPIPEVVDFNYANLTAGGEIAYTSSRAGKSEAPQMIDDMPKTVFEFAPDDPAPVTVVQLETTRQVRRVAVTFEAAKPGELQFYALSALPGNAEVQETVARPADRSEWIQASMPRLLAAPQASAGLPALIKIDPKFFAETKPDGRTQTEPGRHRIAFECPPRDARFVLIRWVPNDGSPCPFAISEINVFGNTREEDVSVAWDEPEPPGEGAERQNQLPLDLPSSTGNSPGSIIPPNLPVVSTR